MSWTALIEKSPSFRRAIFYIRFFESLILESSHGTFENLIFEIDTCNFRKSHFWNRCMELSKISNSKPDHTFFGKSQIWNRGSCALGNLKFEIRLYILSKISNFKSIGSVF